MQGQVIGTALYWLWAEVIVSKLDIMDMEVVGSWDRLEHWYLLLTRADINTHGCFRR